MLLFVAFPCKSATEGFSISPEEYYMTTVPPAFITYKLAQSLIDMPIIVWRMWVFALFQEC